MFVGVHRQREVDRLVRRFAQVCARREPALIAYSAPPGWGKTRIVAEFYRAIAASQPEPAFWPPALGPPPGMADGATADRKVVRHREPFTPPPGAAMPWLWLAPPSGRLSDGSPAPALPGLAEQLRRYLPFARPAGRGRAPNVSPELALDLANVLHQLRTSDDAQPLPTVLVLDDAHDLDAPTAELIAGLLAAELPILIVATLWPDLLGSDEPFPALLAQTRAGGRVTVTSLGRLSDDDLVRLLLHDYPRTDPSLCHRLAARASGNPYSLWLLLATPRVERSVTGGAITLSAADVDDLTGRLDQLLHAHWHRLPADTRQLLVTAALLGPAFLDEVLGAGLRQFHLKGGIDQAVVACWLRWLAGGRLLEFCERLRYELAAAEAVNVLSAHERRRVQESALRATRALLPSEPDGLGRAVLLTLHLTLARAGVERDLGAAAASAMELAERARAEARRPAAIGYLREAQQWLEASGDHRGLVQCLIELATVIRVEHRRRDSAPVAQRALELADRHLADDDERRVGARLALAGALRSRRDPAAYGSCGQLIAEATTLFGRLADPSLDIRYQLQVAVLSKRAADGDYAGAATGTEQLVAFCADVFGPNDRRTLGNLADLGYRLQRCRPAEATVVRRDLLARRQRLARFTNDLQTAPARLDMAVALLATGDDSALAEADELAEEALRLWVRVYGTEAPRSLRARIVRARVWRRRGLVIELAGEPGRAAELYRAAAAETAHVLAVRQASKPLMDDAEPALALQRHGESLAYLRDPDAVPLLDESLRIREIELNQDASFWEVRMCAFGLAWAYRRLARPREAAHVVDQYDLATGAEPAPP